MPKKTLTPEPIVTADGHKVGDKCSIILHSDTQAAQIIEVKNARTIVVAKNRTSWEGISRNPAEAESSEGKVTEGKFDASGAPDLSTFASDGATYTLRKDGNWRVKGEDTSIILTFNFWSSIHDNTY